MDSAKLEALAAELHEVYEIEINRQGKVSRHPANYNNLSEEVKDLDRALAKFILSRDQELAARHAEIGPCGKHLKMFWREKELFLTPEEGVPHEAHCTICQEVLAAEAAVLEPILKVVREVGESTWDAPRWNLHVPQERANKLFDVVYSFDTPARIAALDKHDEELMREKELGVVEHMKGGWHDGCQCEPCLVVSRAVEEARREMRESIINAMAYFFDTHQGTILKSGPVMETLIGRFRALPLTADTQGKVEARCICPTVSNGPEYDLQYVDDCPKHGKQSKEVDTRQPEGATGFCALCQSCGGCTKMHIHCRSCDCQGTGKAGKAEAIPHRITDTCRFGPMCSVHGTQPEGVCPMCHGELGRSTGNLPDQWDSCPDCRGTGKADAM